jgi:hypothetical protein
MIDRVDAAGRALPAPAARPWIPLGLVLLALGASAALLLALAAAETLARHYDPDYLVRSRGFHVFSSTLGWTPRRGVTAVVGGKRVTFDDEGHRSDGRRRRVVRSPVRVAVLGDSIAFGLDVSDEETFASLLDARENGIEALNMAVQGYGPGQELLLLRADALGHVPNVVILAFCLSNDFADATLPVSLYDGRTPKPRFVLIGNDLVLDQSSLRQSSAQRAVQWLSDHSHVFNRLSRPLDAAEPPYELHWHARKRAALADEAQVLRLTLALVREMAEACRVRGVKFLVAAFPSRASYERKSWLVERFVESLKAEQIDVVDMAERFRAHGLQAESIQLDDIGHLNPRGHEAATDILESEVRRLTGLSAHSRASGDGL